MSKEYITVEINDRNHHICHKIAGTTDRYISVVNGRSRVMVQKFCKQLNQMGEDKDDNLHTNL